MQKHWILPILILSGASAYSQECAVEGQRLNRKIDPGVHYTLSHGYCYHYNSTTVQSGYKNHYASVTFMYTNKSSATIRMQDEVYIGYTYDQELLDRLHIGGSAMLNVGKSEPVARFYIDYELYKPLYLHGSVVQVSNRMTHLIAGLKLIL